MDLKFLWINHLPQMRLEPEVSSLQEDTQTTEVRKELVMQSFLFHN